MRKKPIYRLVTVVLLVVLLSTELASATVVLTIDDNGRLAGARNVDVGGALYDVQFIDGTFLEVFGGSQANPRTAPTGYTLDTTSDDQGRLFAAALMSQVFTQDHFNGLYDDNPQLTIGCEYEGCYIRTPVGVGLYFNNATTYGVLSVTAFNSWDEAADMVNPRLYPDLLADNGSGFVTWADWSMASVPETNSFAIWSVLSLVGAGVGHKLKKKIP